jgi:hypothetical protein
MVDKPMSELTSCKNIVLVDKARELSKQSYQYRLCVSRCNDLTLVREFAEKASKTALEITRCLEGIRHLSSQEDVYWLVEDISDAESWALENASIAWQHVNTFFQC